MSDTKKCAVCGIESEPRCRGFLMLFGDIQKVRKKNGANIKSFGFDIRMAKIYMEFPLHEDQYNFCTECFISAIEIAVEALKQKRND